jgi:hypothetical protein
MGRYLLIILLFLSLQVNAGRYLFVINQKDPLFINDTKGWISYFQSRYRSIEVTTLTKYTNAEAGEIIRQYGLNLRQKDTLFIIATAHSHTVNDNGFVILQMGKNDEVNVNDHVIWHYTWEYWLNYLDLKHIRSLIILSVCDPFTLITRQAAEVKSYCTIVYCTDKSDNIMYQYYGSLMLITMKQDMLSDMQSYIDYCSREWLDKRYYSGVDYRDGRSIMECYPIRPVMYGRNFYF